MAQASAATTQAGPEADDAFGDAIQRLLARNPDPFFVQVGGYDGVSFDPLRPHVVRHDLAGVIVEPVPVYFEKLKALYAGNGRVRPVNCAVAEANGERTIWRFKPEAVEQGILPPHFGGISSFLMEDLLAESGVLGRSSPNAETTAALRALAEPVPVQARTLESLLPELGVERVDILQIDTEGYDYRVLQLFDFRRFRPAVVHYEHQHLNLEDRMAAEALLQGHGYRIHREVFDTLAELDSTPPFGEELRRLAQQLQGEGRAGQAIIILEHLAALRPDADALLELVQALRTSGRTLEALARLPALREAGEGQPQVLAELEVTANAAVAMFNACMVGAAVDAAEPYAAGLAALFPGHREIVSAALRCNLTLGRREAAARYAEALLAIEPGSPEALAALAQLAPPAPEAPAEPAKKARAGRRR